MTIGTKVDRYIPANLQFMPYPLSTYDKRIFKLLVHNPKCVQINKIRQ